jgi:hypothetical protein
MTWGGSGGRWQGKLVGDARPRGKGTGGVMRSGWVMAGPLVGWGWKGPAASGSHERDKKPAKTNLMQGGGEKRMLCSIRRNSKGSWSNGCSCLAGPAQQPYHPK